MKINFNIFTKHFVINKIQTSYFFIIYRTRYKNLTYVPTYILFLTLPQNIALIEPSEAIKNKAFAYFESIS